MKRIVSTSVFAFILGVVLSLAAEPYLQTIRGTVIDKDSRIPLPGATIILLGTEPVVGTVTGLDGDFRLAGVPVGRQSIEVSYMGYSQARLTNLLVQTGRELVLQVELEQRAILGEEIVVKANGRKDQPINKVLAVSARSFTVEETEKYAGSRGDVARMAMNFAGVSAANDQRNDIVIRGNSPTGLLWRLEEVDIPNPNHFAAEGTTGGPVGMLNNNLLRNSDFITGAFPAEYGNAMSGVFDLKLRDGNNEKQEYLFQVGFNGFELGAEGPFSTESKSSYLVNYRYSTLGLMDKIGLDMGTSGVPEYQDLSFKVNVPLPKGRISLFGLAGTSSIAILAQPDKETDLYSDTSQDLYNRSTMAATGISFTRLLNERSYARIILSGVYQDGGTEIDTLDLNFNPQYRMKYVNADFRTSIHAYYNNKISQKLTFRFGAISRRLGYSLHGNNYYPEHMERRDWMNESRSLANGVQENRAYGQAVYRVDDRLSLHPGLHLTHFSMSSTLLPEPRLAVRYRITGKQQLSIGYGLHSKLHALSTYFLGSRQPDGRLIPTNQHLEPLLAHHWVLGYDVSINEFTRVKMETYYQHLFHVPVESTSSSFSILNSGAGWGVQSYDNMVNEGTGKNIGIELTLERFFSKNYYYLATVSLFESTYKGSDGIERSTAFNNNYVINMLAGKEFPVKQKAAFFTDLKMSLAGGKRYTPIDVDASRASTSAFNSTVYFEDQAFSKQYPAFFKADVKIGYRVNGKRTSQEWLFFIENVTNHQNVLAEYFDKGRDKVVTVNQLGLFPMMQYRILF